MRTEVFCRTRFEALHRWPEAPESAAFLRSMHRHEFHVEVHVLVQHADRDVEFIGLKHRVDNIIHNARMNGGPGHWSCEHWALHIAKALTEWHEVTKVMVSEDGENGAWVYA